MEYFIGGMLALATAGLAAMVGLDRSRAFYPTVAIVIATYYVLFAVIGASASVLWTEIFFASLISLVAILGFKKNMWLVAVALAGHGVFDFLHYLIVLNPGVPQWWPGFCLTFDVFAGTWLALLLWKRSREAAKSNWPNGE